LELFWVLGGLFGGLGSVMEGPWRPSGAPLGSLCGTMGLLGHYLGALW
jgi:hypothetical protein